MLFLSIYIIYFVLTHNNSCLLAIRHMQCQHYWDFLHYQYEIIPFQFLPCIYHSKAMQVDIITICIFV